jgi:hypothetical protein
MSIPPTTQTTGTHTSRLAKFTPKEREFILWLEKREKKELSPQQINLALHQVKELGDL